MAGRYQIYLIRHGLAEDRGDAWPDDAQRPLTDRGVSRVRKTARGLAAIGVAFDVILTSPLVRARQTADAIASVFEPRPPIVPTDALAPGGSYQALVAELEKTGRRTRIGLVGHEPRAASFRRDDFEFQRVGHWFNCGLRNRVGRLPSIHPIKLP